MNKCKDCKNCIYNDEDKAFECVPMIAKRDMLKRKHPDKKIEGYAHVKQQHDCWFTPSRFIPVNELPDNES